MREQIRPLREPTGVAVHASQAAAVTWVRAGVVTLAVAVFLAVSGAFDTARAPLLVRLGYWVLVLATGGAIGVPVAKALERSGRFQTALPAVAVMTLCIAIPQTFIVWALSGWIFFGAPRLADLPGFAVPVFVVTVGMSTLNVLAGRRPVMTHAPAPGGPSPPAPVKFLERLPLKLRGADLHAVEAEDHYLRLHTDRGSDLILMRLSDAVAELEGLEGAQTHRSWWVAKDAVLDADRADGRAVLKLKGGAQAPVSRTYARALREAGWF
ncbi:LytTR family DNA-binding domain-containing protein [soil metagenome]